MRDWRHFRRGHLECSLSHSIDSLKGVMQGIMYGITVEIVTRDTRSLDYSSLLQSEWLEFGSTTKCNQDAMAQPRLNDP